MAENANKKRDNEDVEMMHCRILGSAGQEELGVRIPKEQFTLPPATNLFTLVLHSKLAADIVCKVHIQLKSPDNACQA